MIYIAVQVSFEAEVILAESDILVKKAAKVIFGENCDEFSIKVTN